MKVSINSIYNLYNYIESADDLDIIFKDVDWQNLTYSQAKAIISKYHPCILGHNKWYCNYKLNHVVNYSILPGVIISFPIIYLPLMDGYDFWKNDIIDNGRC